MTSMHNLILAQISDEIVKTLKELYPSEEFDRKNLYSLITSPPNLEMGHFAFACFIVAKQLKTAPPKIAQALSEKITASGIISKVIWQGPYVNFEISAKAYGELVIEKINSGEFFKRELTTSRPKTMIEYSQPNTHKELHVGHMRNLCLGNALVRIKQYCNQDVVPVTYPGDSGTHVAKCLWYLKYHNQTPAPESHKGEWLGRMYSTANLKLEDELGTEKEANNREQLTEILKQLHAGSGEFYDLWVKTRQWSLDLMKETYNWADVTFDRWFFESEMDAPSLALVNEYYEKGIFVKDAGAIGMNLEEDKLGFCLLVKSDGTGLYATKDVALAIKKFEEFKVEKNIYIVDSRQAFHFKQVFKVLEKIGFKQALDCHHLPYEMVELSDGAMSSRKGNIVALSDLIHQMQEEIKTTYLSKHEGWSKEQVEKTAKDIASAAIKYGMVKMDNNKKIVFEMSEWLKLDGDTGPYLQYVYARINSLIKKIGFDKSQNVSFETLNQTSEFALLQKLSFFNDIVFKAHEMNKTSTLTTYLYELGKLYNSFYAECPINTAAPELKNARLALSLSCANVIKEGLSLLGIQCPEQM